MNIYSCNLKVIWGIYFIIKSNILLDVYVHEENISLLSHLCSSSVVFARNLNVYLSD